MEKYLDVGLDSSNNIVIRRVTTLESVLADRITISLDRAEEFVSALMKTIQRGKEIEKLSPVERLKNINDT